VLLLRGWINGWMDELWDGMGWGGGFGVRSYAEIFLGEVGMRWVGIYLSIMFMRVGIEVGRYSALEFDPRINNK
jgi:hypothetical protein